MAKMPYGSLPENTASRLQGLNQDVLAVAPLAPMPETDSASSARSSQASANVVAGRRSRLSWVALGVALMAVLFAFALWWEQQSSHRQLSELRQQYSQLAAELEEQRAARSVTPQPGLTPMAVSVRDDLRQLSAKVRGLTVAVAKLNSAANGKASLALEERVKTLGSSVTVLSSRVAALNRQPSPAAATKASLKVSDSDLNALQARVNKIDKDLQALYRILQGG